MPDVPQGQRRQKATDHQRQIDRFKEAARKLGCDENEAAFDEKLKKIAKQKAVAKSADQAATQEDE